MGFTRADLPCICLPSLTCSPCLLWLSFAPDFRRSGMLEPPADCVQMAGQGWGFGQFLVALLLAERTRCRTISLPSFGIAAKDCAPPWSFRLQLDMDMSTVKSASVY